MKKFITFAAWAIPVALLAWFAYTLIQHTKPQVQDKTQEIRITVNFNNRPAEGTETVETTRKVPVTCPFSGETKTSEVKTVVKTTKAEPSERRVVITEDAFKETMQQVAYTARQEAQNEYDKNFATLLTILTIFGIAWPVIIGLLQFKFNERELDKINKTQHNANAALKKTDEAFNEIEVIKNLSSNTKDVYSKTLKLVGILFDTNKIVLSSIALGNRDFPDYYYVLALKCAVWSIQVVKDVGIPDGALENMISNANLIEPQYKSYDVTKSSRDILKQIREDLQKNIKASGKDLDLTVKLFNLLDEKIAAYEKLLATTDNNNK